MSIDLKWQELSTEELLRECSSKSSRVEFWVEFIRRAGIGKMVEVGVFEGDFASVVLRRCPGIETYYMLDPWRHLPNWNKPANQEDDVFNRLYESAKRKTDFAADRRVVLRGMTTEVIDEIPDASLDFAYVDGDHTLKGITIDLIRVYAKVSAGGFIGGDDFTPTIWQHSSRYEPTLVYPFAVYFAEAAGATIYALPNCQFCIEKSTTAVFKFVDLTGRYTERSLQHQLSPERVLKLWAREKFPTMAGLVGKIRNSMVRAK
ncbi:MAG TPA: class I SAM-dependent methyltransferase [Candidatus Binatia bacterium]|nr:class I SAM-dependent methyltransferase [Candidatus Binatia bacterium]